MSTLRVPFSPPSITEREVAAVAETLRSGWITTGPRTHAFEAALRDRCGAEAALALNSCTAGLHLALAALGIGPGDEVVVPSMTFCSSANVVAHVGARPVLADVEADTLNLCPRSLERVLTPATRAVIAVHYAGHPADLAGIAAVIGEREVAVIEDAAHAIGAAIGDTPVGGSGNPTAFSFYATKNLATGEGGMLLGEEELIERARVLSLHGMSKDAWRRYGGGPWRYDVADAGFKYNMGDLQAALGLVQLERFDQMQAVRRRAVRAYRSALADCDLVELPAERAGITHAWHLFPVRLVAAALAIDRDRVIDSLAELGIATSVHFIPLHRHSHYRDRLGWRPEQAPVAEDAWGRILSLPLHGALEEAVAAEVGACLRDLLERHRV